VDWHALLVRRATRAAVVTLVLASIGPGLSSAENAATPAAPGAAEPAAGGIAHPGQWPAVPRAIPESAQVEKSVEQLLGSLTLEEKVGQLIQADIDSIKPADLARYPLGSILAGGNAAPGGDIHATGAKWLELTDALFRASMQNSSPKHPPIPIIFGIDAVHGHAKIDRKRVV